MPFFRTVMRSESVLPVVASAHQNGSMAENKRPSPRILPARADRLRLMANSGFETDDLPRNAMEGLHPP
jgi:hypothetical protein